MSHFIIRCHVSPVTCHLSPDHPSMQLQLVWWCGCGKFGDRKSFFFITVGYCVLAPLGAEWHTQTNRQTSQRLDWAGLGAGRVKIFKYMSWQIKWVSESLTYQPNWLWVVEWMVHFWGISFAAPSQPPEPLFINSLENISMTWGRARRISSCGS